MSVYGDDVRGNVCPPPGVEAMAVYRRFTPYAELDLG
jgi:hypothetical protein